MTATTLWIILGCLVAYAIWVAAVQDVDGGDGGITDRNNAIAAEMLDPRAREILSEDAGYYDFHDPKNPRSHHE